MTMTKTSCQPVEYFKIPGAPGDYFVCPRYHGNAKLSVSACAAQWERARKGGEDARIRLHACVNCPIGAKHAGVTDFVPQNELQTRRICTRCHRDADRIIYGRLCVSCANRQYEFEKGRNARGNKPIRCPSLHRIAILVREGEKPAREQQFTAVDMLEVMLSAIKTSKDRVVIGFKGTPPRPAAEQLSLF